MHAETLTAAIDAWLGELREECEIEVERRDVGASGETLVVTADDNPWEDHAGTSLSVSIIPPRDGRTRVLFLATGHDRERDIHFAYFDLQTSLGEFVDVADQHRIHVWMGRSPDEAATAAIRDRYEEAVRDGIWEHLISVEQLIKDIRPTTPLGHNVADLVGRINRRMA